MNHLDRNPITISLSEDNGHTWPFTYILDEEPAACYYKFFSPAAIPSPEGVSIAYSLDRENITFIRLSIEHIKGW